MKHSKTNTKEQSPQSVGHKKYVPYGINGAYYVYDNDEGRTLPGAVGSPKNVVQTICDQLNSELTKKEQVWHTPGELWRDDDGFIAQGKGEDYKTVIDARILIEDDGTLIDNLLTAYNNTYAKGINPEAVPDLLEALKMYKDYWDSTEYHGLWPVFLRPVTAKIQEAINKATKQ